MSKNIEYFIDLSIVDGDYPDWKILRKRQQENPKLVPWLDPDGGFVYWAETEPTPEDIELFWEPEVERFELVVNPESKSPNLTDEIRAANASGHVYIRDNLKGKIVAMLNPPYGQIVCLESSTSTGFSKLVEWMNSLSQDELRSEGIGEYPI